MPEVYFKEITVDPLLTHALLAKPLPVPGSMLGPRLALNEPCPTPFQEL